MFKLLSNLCRVAVLFALAGCVVGGAASRATPVLGGVMNIGVPAGYCIDSKVSRETSDGVVMLMGRCTDAVKAKPALISVSVGQGGSAGVMTAGGPALTAFFNSGPGRAALSRDGRAQNVKIVQALMAGDAFLMRLQDRNAGEYWRAVIGVKGRLVTVSASGTEEVPLPQDQGKALVEITLDALRKANPV